MDIFGPLFEKMNLLIPQKAGDKIPVVEKRAEKKVGTVANKTAAPKKNEKLLGTTSALTYA